MLEQVFTADKIVQIQRLPFPYVVCDDKLS